MCSCYNKGIHDLLQLWYGAFCVGWHYMAAKWRQICKCRKFCHLFAWHLKHSAEHTMSVLVASVQVQYTSAGHEQNSALLTTAPCRVLGSNLVPQCSCCG